VKEDVRAWIDVLEAWRKRIHATQDEVAAALGISRRVYLLFETARWFPAPRERHFFVHRLHALDPEVGEACARILGGTAADFGVAPLAAAPPLDAAQARAAYDAAVYGAAEETDVPPPTARILVASVIEKLRQAGVTMEQAEELAPSPRALPPHRDDG
jgi:hypothetical protein